MLSLRDEQPIAGPYAHRIARIISHARRASLFCSARSAEQNVCGRLRLSAANINFPLQASAYLPE